MIFRMLESAIIKGLDTLASFATRNQPRMQKPSDITLGRVAHPYHHDKWEEVALGVMPRLTHLYCVGATGSGKSKLLQHLIQQDILAGNGFALIDPHGDLTTNVLCFLAKLFDPLKIDELGKRLMLIEPFDRQFATGFNPIHTDGDCFAVSLELMDIFRRFWGDGYWGPRMDELLRNLLVTLSQNNLTLLEARPLLTHSTFRAKLVENVPFSEIRDYWDYRYNALSEKMQGVYREPVLNKITAFISDPSIYRILGQQKSTISFRAAMDQGRWVLLNLSKGHLKENVRLLGSLFLTKIKQASLSRIDTPEEDRRPFFTYADEFQNFVQEDIETLLSESRKFRVGLTLAHQNLEQLPPPLRSAILGNVGTEIFFRLSHRDASQVSSELDQKERHLIEKRLTGFRVGEAYLSIKGQKPQLFKTLHVPSLPVAAKAIDAVKSASFERWATPVEQVEKEIGERRNLWANQGARQNNGFKDSAIESKLEYYEPTKTPGSFEEGQSEW